MKFYFYCISTFMYIFVFHCLSAQIWISGIREVCSFSILLCMSPTWSRYKELGIYLVEPLQDQPHKPRQPHMGEEKKDDGSRYPIKIWLEKTLKKNRNMVMEKVSHILQRLPIGDTSTYSSHSGGANPFKVKLKFDIPIFEGQIDVYIIDRWLNLLEGYFLVQYFLV